MKILKEELYNTIEFLNKINKESFFKIDFSDLFNKDLTEEETNKIKEYFWINEKLNNFEIINKIIKDKIIK